MIEVELTPRRETTFEEDLRSKHALADPEIELAVLMDDFSVPVEEQAKRCRPLGAKALRIAGKPEQKHPLGRRNAAAYLQAIERGHL